jgi:hypothetical protein
VNPGKPGGREESLYTIGRQNGAVFAPLMREPVSGTQEQEIVSLKFVQGYFERQLTVDRKPRAPTEYICYQQAVGRHNPQDSSDLQCPMAFG